MSMGLPSVLFAGYGKETECERGYCYCEKAAQAVLVGFP